MPPSSGAVRQAFRNVPGMAFRTWGSLLGATAGAAALAGASQLGLAYGLGVLRFARVLDVTARDEWTAQLAWVAWIAMTAAAIGGIVGRARLPRQAGASTRIVTAVAAGLGGAVVVPLTMQPARTAQVAGVDPVLVIGICAALAALAGMVAAYAALSRAVARWSLTAAGIAVWVLAIASVAPRDPLPAVRLGVLDAAFLSSSVTQRTALIIMPALALVAGAVLGWAARRRDMSLLDITLAGLPGPALLTVAYLIAGPGSGADRYQMVPYWAAMTATGAGVLGSVLAAVLRRGPADIGQTRPGRPPAGQPADGAPTPDRPPLPRRDAQPASAIAQAAAVAAQRPEHELRPSDTGVFAVRDDAPFDGFIPPQTRAATASAAVPQPAAPQPAMTQPAMTQPAMTQPAMTQPDGPQPAAASQPVDPAHRNAAFPATPHGSAAIPHSNPAIPHGNPAVPPSRAAVRPEPTPLTPAAAPAPAPQPRGRGRKNEVDGDFVDWVSDLGTTDRGSSR